MSEDIRRRWSTKRRWLACILYAVFHISVHAVMSFVVATTPIKRYLCSAKYCNKNADDGGFRKISNSDEGSMYISSPGSLDMKTYQVRKHKLMLQKRQQQWHQPPNPLLEDPIEFVQAILVALQQRKKNSSWNGALCLLESSTPSWRRILLKSIGAPPSATNDEVAPRLQNAIERPNTQFAILTKKLDDNIIDENTFSIATTSIQKSWQFPSDPVIFESDNDEIQNDGNKDERIIQHCWVESRLRSPNDNELLAVVGWNLQRRQIVYKDQENSKGDNIRNANDSISYWLLDDLQWQDFRDEFRPGIGREEWTRICG